MSIRYGSSGDIRGALGNPSSEEVSGADLLLSQGKATSLVDAYLEGQFPDIVPWTVEANVPNLINSITNDLSVYYIKRDKNPGPMPLAENVKVEYWDKSVDLLVKITSRELQLPEMTSQINDQVASNRGAFNPVFDVDDIQSQDVDPELKDDIAGNKG